MIIKEAISPVAMGKFPVDSVLGKSENHPVTNRLKTGLNRIVTQKENQHI